MQDNSEEHRSEQRREQDRLTEYRLGKLEQIVDKVVENQTTLTRIEQTAIHTAASLGKIEERLEYQGKTMDAWSRELEAHKTTLSIHSWALRAVAAGAIGTVIKMILVLKDAVP